MTQSRPPHRQLLALSTALSTALAVALPAAPALAQDATPPSRVGQIAALNGNVSFDGSGSGGWAQAALNYPINAGDTLYTQNNAGAAIALDSSRINLASGTELQVTALDDDDFAATQSQGEAVYAIDNLQQGQRFTITTPRGTVGITQNGQYDITAGDAVTPTTVNVFQGAATLTDPGANLALSAGQAAYLSGTNTTTAQTGQAQQDGFASSVLVQYAPPPSYAPPVVQQMTGTAELGQYGSWDQSPQYGAVWYPTVAPGWAPYRNGYWANVQPWGWTWVESEPWGFAPFHYGRWVDDGDRWGWAPAPAYSPQGGYGAQYQPVYAPAVVSFFGVALAAGITVAALSSGSVGWVPLAPNEPYYPSYHAPPAYIRQINYVNVHNIDTVNVTNNYYGGNFAPGKLANHRGATYIPADVMRNGEHVGGYAHPAPQTMLAAARPVDPGAGARPAGQPAAYQLPAAGRKLAQIRPGIAPTPSEFAQRRHLPPASISHAPFEGAAPHGAGGAMPAVSHPGFATSPGFHAPPSPPAAGQHLSALPPAQTLHPAGEHPPSPHPQTPSYPAQNAAAEHPAHPMPAVQPYHPPAEAPVFHPPAPAHPGPEIAPYHPVIEAPHPAAPAYHPPAQAFHPAGMAQPHPVQNPHPPAVHEELPHPDPAKHPG